MLQERRRNRLKEVRASVESWSDVSSEEGHPSRSQGQGGVVLDFAQERDSV
jgi:hypothetical protein